MGQNFVEKMARADLLQGLRVGVADWCGGGLSCFLDLGATLPSSCS
jgi:hypothetical protein